MTDIISVPSTSARGDGVVYYDIHTRLPLRVAKVSRRYSEFVRLMEELCDELGIKTKDFPYALPPKAVPWFGRSGDDVTEDRKVKLHNFLNQVIRDRDLQNRKLVHDFLSIPANFTITPALFRGKDSEEGVVGVDATSIDQYLWMEYYRHLRHEITELGEDIDAADVDKKIGIRRKIYNFVSPTLLKLSEALEYMAASDTVAREEISRRRALVKTLGEEIETLVQRSVPHKSNTASFLKRNTRRVLGDDKNEAQETKDTISLDNNELLQSQLEMQKNQDLDISELRRIIYRQRELGETIRDEVEEQNVMLDQFSDEVDKSSRNMKSARRKAKDIL